MRRIKVANIGQGKYITYKEKYCGPRLKGISYQIYFVCATCGKDQQYKTVGSPRRIRPKCIVCRRCGSAFGPVFTWRQRRILWRWRRWAKKKLSIA